jgi:hypothetical protein
MILAELGLYKVRHYCHTNQILTAATLNNPCFVRVSPNPGFFLTIINQDHLIHHNPNFGNLSKHTGK